PHYNSDTGGSICEWVDPDDPQDEILTALSQQALMVWVRGTEAHTDELIRRFDKAPKPMAYRPDFLAAGWDAYLEETGLTGDKVNPDAFIRWTYARALAHRQPLYEGMARNWGVTVEAEDMARVQTEADFTDLIANALPG
ncbi:unnamed protein product, partial [Chrysoparadoxa australica]